MQPEQAGTTKASRSQKIHFQLRLITYSEICSAVLYFLTNKDFPVISFGCYIPIKSIKVGTMSHSAPPSLSPWEGSAFTRMKGTGLVVWAV